MASIAAIAVVVYQFVLRFHVGGLPMAAPEAAGAPADPALFTRAWPYFVAYAGAATGALLLGPPALARALRSAPVGNAFFAACAAAAIAGAGLGIVVADQGTGGATMPFYWGGLAGIWLVCVAMALWARPRSTPALRDWTIYCYALALLPLTTWPSVPLWRQLAGMTADEAVITAVTMAFASHLLVAHYFIFERLERRAPR
ncbi:MAG: hypothetical protein IT495_02175 [Gammaproteobacteria bacterium]|nr:hypothetical protein [Gammaproteobacteria bacterium]